MRVLRRIVHLLGEYGILVIILVLGLRLWTEVFNAAVVDYLSTSYWNSRSVWLGNGMVEIFGLTVNFQFEGYSDYSFYYVHWGHNILNGVMPYCDEFGVLTRNGITNRNGLYIFPPLTALFYAAGILIPVDDYGVGILLAAFGYLTVFPVYGLARELSDNRHVGEAAALTYLLNPNILYHITFSWLNPSIFVFFVTSSLYALVRGRQYTSVILMVTAGLFKQTAWFCGLTLIIYLILRPRSSSTKSPEAGTTTIDTATPIQRGERWKRMLAPILQYFDIRGFVRACIVGALYAGVIVFPFLLVEGRNMMIYMGLASGAISLDSLTEPPSYAMPIRVQVLPVVAGMPWLAYILNAIIYYGFALSCGVVLYAGLMFIEPKDLSHRRYYFRRLLFLTMMLLLWVHLTGPRGVYKYYFTALAPFFSIFSSVNMVKSREERVPFSFSMLWVPLAVTLVYLVPHRNVYLLGVVFIVLGYLLAAQIGTLWAILTTPVRIIRRLLNRLSRRLKVMIITTLTEYTHRPLRSLLAIRTEPMPQLFHCCGAHHGGCG